MLALYWKRYDIDYDKLYEIVENNYEKDPENLPILLNAYFVDLLQDWIGFVMIFLMCIMFNSALTVIM